MERLLFNLRRKSVGAGVLMSMGGRAHLGFPYAQLYDPFLSFLKGLYLHEELAIDLCDCFSAVVVGLLLAG